MFDDVITGPVVVYVMLHVMLSVVYDGNVTLIVIFNHAHM